MRYLHPEHDAHLELSLEDVFIVPQFYDGKSRLDVDLTPVDFPGGAHPVVSANMNAVTGKRMAETMARYGGLGVLPQKLDWIFSKNLEVMGGALVDDISVSQSQEIEVESYAGVGKKAHRPDLMVKLLQ